MRTPHIRAVLCVLATCATLPALTLDAAPAAASPGETVYFDAGTALLDAKTRPGAVKQLVHLGVKAIRLELAWADVAPDPNSRSVPTFAATNPAAYDWGEYDAVMAEAKRLGWRVLLTVTSPVPEWATSAHKDHLTRPDAQYFKEFMTAVGRHYGSEVSLYAIWNEPNHPAFLLPQFLANHQPASPAIYRKLFLSGYAGLEAAGISHPKVLMGETAPTGTDTGSGLHDVAPLAFLRGVLCLNASYHRSGSCPMLPASGYAHHAYTLASGPSYQPPNPDDVTIGVLGRLVRALNLAAKAGAIRADTPIYLTEFGIQSYPNKFLGVSPAKQVEYDAIAEKIAWSDPRVAAFSQYLLRDDPLGGPPGSGVTGGYVGFQTGLEYHNGNPKPLYAAWPVPLVVTSLGAGRGVALWGLIRPADGPTSATVLVQAKGSHHWRKLATVHAGSSGSWSLRSTVAGAWWRVRWVSPSHVVYEGPPIPAS
jgi:hypothetical protein